MNVFHGSKKKKRMRKIKFQNLQENCLIWEMKLLIFLKKDFFHIKMIHSKPKKKNQRRNQKKNQKKNKKKNKFFEYIENEPKSLNYDLFERHFNLLAPTVLAKKII